MSILSTLPVFLLSNSVALNKLLQEDCCEHVLLAEKAREFWRRWVGMACRMRDSSRPGHVYAKRWEAYSVQHGVGLLAALDCVGDEYLEVVNRRLYVRSWEKFARWQNLRSRMTMLPVKCRMLYRNALPMCDELVHPLSPSMADFINREGLNETHLHLYACQKPEVSWLVDLSGLSRFLVKEQQNWKAHCDLYYGVHAELTPQRLVRRMRLARFMRCLLLSVFQNEVDAEVAVERMWRAYHDFVSTGGLAAPEDAGTPMAGVEELVQQEMLFWRLLFEWVDERKSFTGDFSFFAHLYLLIQNEYTHLRRQREERQGFDAFHEVSRHKGDGVSHTQYLNNTLLHILQNTRATSQNRIELRVSPRTFCKQGKQIVHLWQDCCDEVGMTPPGLVLVVHFIKKKGYSSGNEEKMLLADKYALRRKEYMQECKKVSAYAAYLCAEMGISLGIDAAGDEMLTPPEVLAPVFRQFVRKTGINHKTYHCGEDFVHLVGGIRAVHEAVLFLDLKCGNRVGHATAIGIAPELWKQDMPDVIVQRQGDALLDMVFAWRMLTPSQLEAAAKVEQRLMPLAQELLGELVNIHALLAFYDARQLQPEKVREFLESESLPAWSPDPEEQLVIDFYRKRGRVGLDLVKRWNYDAHSRAMQEKNYELELDFFDDETLVYLQQKVQRQINERNVIIETLPVSNLRISQYHDIREHHLLRWLRVPGTGYEGDEEMMVSIGSDDPGIFASDLKNEYYHVFSCLKQAGIASADCMHYIRRLNDAGRIYSFSLDIPLSSYLMRDP